MGSEYDEKDAAKETDSSNKDVAGAWHDARDDSRVRDGGDKEHFEKAPSDGPQSEGGISLYPEDKK